MHGRRKFTLRFLSSYTVKCALQPREVYKLKTDWITPTRKLRIVVRHGNLSNPIKVFDSSWGEIVILIFFLIPVCVACKSVSRYEKSWAFIAAARRPLMRAGRRIPQGSLHLPSPDWQLQSTNTKLKAKMHSDSTTSVSIRCVLCSIFMAILMTLL